MTPEELTKHINDLDLSVATARTHSDAKKRQEAIDKANGIACLLVTRVTRELEQFVKENFESYQGIPVSVATLANKEGSKDEETFRIFRNGREFSYFIEALKDALIVSGHSEEFAAEVADECYRSFFAMSQCTLDPYFFKETFERNKIYFCDEPGLKDDDLGKGGGPRTPRKPPGRPTSPWFKLAYGVLTLATAIVNHDATADKRPETPPPSPPPIIREFDLKLLTLLLLATLRTWLEDSGLITVEKSQPKDPVGAAKPKEQVFAG